MGIHLVRSAPLTILGFGVLWEGHKKDYPEHSFLLGQRCMARCGPLTIYGLSRQMTSESRNDHYV